MAYIDIDIEDHLNEVKTHHLMRELLGRRLKKEDLQTLKGLLDDADDSDSDKLFFASNLDEQLKLELFKEVVNVLSFSELEKRLR